MKQLFIGGYGPSILTASKDLDVIARTAAVKASFLASHPTLPVLYAVGEEDSGTVTAYTVTGGELSLLGERPSEGSQPCHLAVHPGGELLAVANYGDGVVSLHRLDEAGAFAGDPLVLAHQGSGPVWERQERSHAHQAVFHEDVLHVSDLGTDEIRRYALDGRALEFVKLPAGMGPRHLVFAGGRCHVAGELDAMVRTYDGDWNELAAAVASEEPGTNYPSHIDAAGDYVYVGNRGPDTISVLRGSDLAMVAEVPSGATWPRHFAIDGTGMYVANQTGDAVTLLTLRGGIPRPTDVKLDVVAPACVLPR
ncbi:beta-propeller fold lactonase family protein [Nonomuraea sp. NPDC049152]|uniref:lactonase family protein n=1 Tax=Nonomuraea sp. NPDC049152 TaxID=3154350 RepID=UPI0033E39E39